MDDVGAPAGGVGVEGDRPADRRLQPGGEPGQGALPEPAHGRDGEHLRVGVDLVDRDQRGLGGEPQRSVDDPAGVERGQVHRRLDVGIPPGQLGELAVEVHRTGERLGDDRAAVVRLGSSRCAGAEEVRLDVAVDDLVDRAEVAGDRAHLLGDATQEGQVAGIPARVGDGREVVDLRREPLAVPVDAADPLLEPRRVERHVVADQAVTVGLQVDALACGVRGDEHPHRVLGRVLGEAVPDHLPLVGRRGAGDGGQDRAVAVLLEHPHDPVAGCRRTR